MKQTLFILVCMLMTIGMYSQNEEKEKTIKKEQVVTVDVRKDGESERTVKIVSKADGEEKVLEWSDDGEIPDEVLEQLEEAGIDIEILEGGDDQEIKIHIDSESDGGNYMYITTDEEEIEMDGDQKVIIVKKIGDGHDGKRKHRIKKRMKGGNQSQLIIVDEDGEEQIIKLEGMGKGLHKGMRWLHDGDETKIYGAPHLADAHGPSDAYMGAQIGNAEDTGVEVLELIKDGPADKAGLQVGDVINEVNGANAKNVNGLMTLLGFFDPGDKVEVMLSREGKEKKISLELGQRPDYYK